MTTRLIIVTAVSIFLANCTETDSNEQSEVAVTTVAHSQVVKRQTINNCWIYAAASWLESLSIASGSGDLDVSESYWAYWHWYKELSVGIDGSGHGRKKLEEGGGWHLGKGIVREFGWVTEAEFIPAEASSVASDRQKCALDMVKRELEPDGRLYYSSFDKREEVRSHEKVVALLNEAFTCGDSNQPVDGEAVRNQFARAAADTMLNFPGETSKISLDEMYDEWDVWQPAGRLETKSSKMLPLQKDQNFFNGLSLALRQALNDGMPVVLGFNLDFNAVNPDNGMFDLNSYAKSEDSKKAAHMIVLSDYAVTNAPGFGDLPEGNLSADKKAAALSGDLAYIVAKNSWGTAATRDNREWIKDGYSRLTWDYLTQGFVDRSQSYQPMMTAIVLPKRYKIKLD